MGSGREAHADAARPVGSLLAAMGVHLLTGGGGGVMRSVSEAFVAVQPRTGRCIGILPGSVTDAGYAAPAGYPNEFVEIAVRSHLPGRGDAGESRDSRNWINVLSSDALIFLPGGAGTASEAHLAEVLERPAISFGAGAGFAHMPHARDLSDVEEFLRSQLDGSGRP